jgi:hypothetical protein
MSDALKDAVRANFTVGKALGLGVDVMRRRPGSFARLAIIQAMAFAIPSLAMFYVMGVFGSQLSDGAADPTALLRAQGLMTLAFVPIYVSIIAISIWIEACWLDLFLNDRVTLAPKMGRAIWLLLAFVIIFGVFFAAYFVAVIGIAIAAALAMVSDGAIAAVLTGIAIFLAFILFILLVLARFTALPALSYMEGSLPLGKAWKAAGAKQGGLTLAWLAFAFMYLVLVVGFGLFLAFGPGPYSDAMRHQFENLNNPNAQYEVYAQVASDPIQMAVLAVILVVGGLLYVPLAMISRGIGVSLARAASKES